MFILLQPDASWDDVYETQYVRFEEDSPQVGEAPGATLGSAREQALAAPDGVSGAGRAARSRLLDEPRADGSVAALLPWGAPGSRSRLHRGLS